MQTKQVIQSTANVIRITTLAKGNLYKRMKKEYSDTYKPVYGIVTDIMNDGENTFIEVMEYEKSYGSTTNEIRVIAGNEDVAVFPTTVEEVKQHFTDSLERIRNDIEEAKETVKKKEKLYAVAQQFIEGEMQKTLTEVSYEEIPQKEYESQKELASA